MADYQIFTDSCSDLSKQDRDENNIKYLRMGLVVDGKEMFADLDWEDYTPSEFYDWLASGKKIKTTQVSYEEICSKFERVLKEGKDILYLGCSSALSGSVSFAKSIWENELSKKYPERKLIVYDTLCGSPTQGLLVFFAAKKQQEGLTIDELVKWVDENKFKFNQFATVDTLTYLKNAGRIKGIKALMGNLIHKKPIFISDRKGNNYTIGTVIGTKNADDMIYKAIKAVIDLENYKFVVIGQANCMERALKLKKRFEEEMKVKVVIWQIGPIVGTTCGPGVLSTFCYGKEVTLYDGDGIKPELY